MKLDLSADAAALTASIVDVPSVSGEEGNLADAIETALRALPHLSVLRDGNSIVARTDLGRPHRVVLAGHIDTVPVAGNLPSRRERDAPSGQERLYGCGTTDMKAGVAVQLRLAASVPEPVRDVTYVFYDCEEIEAARNGLGLVEPEPPRAARRELRGPDGAERMRDRGRLPGHHAGRSDRVRPPRAQCPVLDGPQRHPRGGRYHRRPAPLRAEAARGGRPHLPRRAERGRHHRRGRGQRDPRPVRGHGELPVRAGPGHRCRRTAPPRGIRRLGRVRGRRRPRGPARAGPGTGGLVRRGRGRRAAGQARLDRRGPVRRCGIPAVNYGPGISEIAHTPDEYVEVPKIFHCEQRMRAWLTRP